MTGLVSQKASRAKSATQRAAMVVPIVLFGGHMDDSALDPNTFGKQVQVNNNFVIVHTTGKYPKREILYRD